MPAPLVFQPPLQIIIAQSLISTEQYVLSILASMVYCSHLPKKGKLHLPMRAVVTAVPWSLPVFAKSAYLPIHLPTNVYSRNFEQVLFYINSLFIVSDIYDRTIFIIIRVVAFVDGF